MVQLFSDINITGPSVPWHSVMITRYVYKCSKIVISRAYNQCSHSLSISFLI